MESGNKKAGTLNQVLDMPEDPTRSLTSETRHELLDTDNNNITQPSGSIKPDKGRSKNFRDAGHKTAPPSPLGGQRSRFVGIC